MRISGLRRLLLAIPPAFVIMAGTLAGSPGEQATASVVHVHSQPDAAAVGAQFPAAAGTFLETFDGLPSSPLPFSNPNGWDIFPGGLDTRQNGTAAQRAHHGPNCGAPGFPYTATNSHPLQTTDDTVFICNNHLMTATGLVGYGAIYMVPPAMADYSNGTATVRFEMSTLRTGSRDWVYFTLAPFHEHNKVFDDGDSHVPQDSINLRLELGSAATPSRSGTTCRRRISSRPTRPGAMSSRSRSRARTCASASLAIAPGRPTSTRARKASAG